MNAPDDGGGSQERQAVDVEGQPLLVELPRVDPTLVGEALGELGEERSDAGRHGEHAVRRRHIERVGGGELLLRDDVRDDRFLRRRPQHREDLENERGEDQSEQAVDERQREEDERPTDIAEQHHPLAIEAVDDHTCRSGEEEPRSDTGREDQRNRGSLRPVADAFGERDDRNQAEPVTRCRDDLGDPELEELPRSEDRVDAATRARGTDCILQAIRTGTGGAHADDLRGPRAAA